jgi:hypothetical protein
MNQEQFKEEWIDILNQDIVNFMFEDFNEEFSYTRR